MIEHTAILELYQAALNGANPGDATARAVEALQIPRERRVLLFAVGKAASTMAAAAADTLLTSLHQIVGGVMVTPDGERSPYPTVISVRGDHPIPGAGSQLAADRIGEVTAGRRATDVALVLVSGGASSLIAAPLRDQKPADLIALYELLLGSGLDIAAINGIRKRFSRWAGGRLALALAPAAVRCLAVSDVPGDGIAEIGSGPCAPDPRTAADIRQLLDASGLSARVAPALLEYLAAVTRGITPETPKPSHPAFAHVMSRVIINNRSALEAVADAAGVRGIRAEIREPLLSGPAAAAGEEIARKLIVANATRTGSRRCLVWGGETSVAIEGPAVATRGGRCQEMALAAARVLAEAGDQSAGIQFLAAGTDGRDGVTEAAGAIVDRETWGNIVAAGIDPAAALSNHGSHSALAAAGALVPRRRTGTNVMDVVIGLLS